MDFFISKKDNKLSLFSKKEFNTGDIIHILYGPISNTFSNGSIYIGNNKYIIDKYGKYINYSNMSNIKINGLAVIATQKIMVNDEICLPY